jgi:ABC-type oligopeptide transport system substrate-binding subunit
MTMRRQALVALPGLALVTSLMLAGCGGSALTLNFSENGITGSLVAQSDATAISALQASAANGFGGLQNASLSNGSNPQGSQLCSWSYTSGSGHSYQLALYAEDPTSNLVVAFKAELCTASGEQSMDSGMP